MIDGCDEFLEAVNDLRASAFADGLMVGLVAGAIAGAALLGLIWWLH